jgi:hypothetical protein
MVVVLSVFRALLRRASAVQRALRKERAKWLVGLGAAPSDVPPRGIGQITSLAVSPTKISGLPRQAPPLHIRINSAAFCWLNYRKINLVEVEGLAPPERLGVGQLP